MTPVFFYFFSDTHFWIGQGLEPDEYGEAIPDESGSYDALGRYLNQTVILTLPKHTDVFNIDYLSIYSKALKRSLAHVDIPAMTLNVPPALAQMVHPQV